MFKQGEEEFFQIYVCCTVPIRSYRYISKNKLIICEENKKKSGIYRLNNLITGKSYVGS